ncbi:D-alanyl-D-alanine carboxypeptidase family protein [Ectobacillus polymachus]|uniref:D-alanyl-D-alanine carboxypeptidase family protein n=1 Tax=Ectobacillus polymachus TaxID=1508806 RepID=UPI003A8AA661
MWRKYVFLMCLACFCMVPLPTYAFSVSAHNAVLMEQQSGRVLYERLPNESKGIASITKIMTAILAVESGKLKNTVTISDQAVRVEGSSIYLRAGDQVKLEDLVYGLMLRSGNDAAQAIAEYVGGSMEGFVYLMNQKAASIGMTDTHFSNPSGLDGDGQHYSSAYDMALLTRYAMQNTTFQKIFGTKTYRSSAWDYPWNNKHKLVTSLYEFATGGKTGFTKKVGRTLVTTASKNGMDLIVVTLNDSNDWDDHTNLFEQAFQDYKMVSILKKGAYEVHETDLNRHVYLLQDFTYPLTNEESQKVTVTTQWYKKRGVEEGEIVGKVIISLDGQKIGERNLLYSKRLLVSVTGDLWRDFCQVFTSVLGVSYNG